MSAVSSFCLSLCLLSSALGSSALFVSAISLPCSASFPCICLVPLLLPHFLASLLPFTRLDI